MNTPSNFRSIVPASDHKVAEAIAPALPSTVLIECIELAAKKFIASLNEQALKTFNGRLERGLELARQGAVIKSADAAHPRRYQVRSSDAQKAYWVDLDARSCECPDSQKGFTCKHRVAAYYVEQASKMEAEKKPAQLPSQEQQTKPAAVTPAPVSPTRSAISPVAPKPQPAAPVGPAPLPVKKTEEQILKELGYEPEAPKVKDPGYQLGSLYRRYLHGSDLAGQVFPVTIQGISKEKVMPHPSQPVVEKWCLTVSGLPASLANKILFGARGEEDLVAIFGQVSVESLKGKQIMIYPKAMNVAGAQKVSIRFRSVR
jgi:hypothetical protein